MTSDRDDLLVRTALRHGAQGAAVITQSRIVLSASFRAICEGGGCGYYGRCWMCPPDIGSIEALMPRVRQYPFGLLYQTIGLLKNSFDVEGMTACAAAHAQTSRRLGHALMPLLPKGFLHLSCGGCHLCGVCAKRNDRPCRHPREALPPMEGYGVDVYRTAQDTGLKYTNGQNTVTFFGMVLFGA